MIYNFPFQDRTIDECFQIDDQVCDLFIREDCEYIGAILSEPPPGTISNPKQCEQLCIQYEQIGCEYWVYYQMLTTCTLLKSGDRACHTWGGPRAPSFAECTGKQLQN